MDKKICSKRQHGLNVLGDEVMVVGGGDVLGGQDVTRPSLSKPSPTTGHSHAGSGAVGLSHVVVFVLWFS